MKKTNEKGYKIVYVNPLARISHQGRHKQVYTIRTESGELIPTKGMNKSMESGVSKQYAFPYDHRTNSLKTGLDVMIDNTNLFYEREANDVIGQYGLTNEWYEIVERIVKQPKIKKQTYFEIISGVSPDFYTSKIACGTIFQGVSHFDAKCKPNFLERFKLVLYPKPNRFTTETPRGRLSIELIKILKSSIANDKVSANSALHEWYISEENEAEKDRVQKQEVINDAVYNLVKLQKEFSEYRNYQTAILLKRFDGNPLLKGEVSLRTVKDLMNKYINDNDTYQMDNIEKFNTLMDLVNKPDGIARFDTMYLIQQASNCNVITVRDGFYIWHSKAGTPNVYKFTDHNKLVDFMLKEYEIFDPEQAEITNWYGELAEEVKTKGIKVNL